MLISARIYICTETQTHGVSNSAQNPQLYWPTQHRLVKQLSSVLPAHSLWQPACSTPARPHTSAHATSLTTLHSSKLVLTYCIPTHTCSPCLYFTTKLGKENPNRLTPKLILTDPDHSKKHQHVWKKSVLTSVRTHSCPIWASTSQVASHLPVDAASDPDPALAAYRKFKNFSARERRLSPTSSTMKLAHQRLKLRYPNPVHDRNLILRWFVLENQRKFHEQNPLAEMVRTTSDGDGRSRRDAGDDASDAMTSRKNEEEEEEEKNITRWEKGILNPEYQL
ncbi:hypothetical protein F511_43168 [Dorcoceras hygrometricum]|uniref:Uncharacterized protein n=1 Tax=Dorcoceras hygrometricum TaxID=472368 RepID=A0A2Z7DJL7_9LAMI|nr:hypothetical protein F511_43168 [Dorcoceras hygrometricum]